MTAEISSKLGCLVLLGRGFYGGIGDSLLMFTSSAVTPTMRINSKKG